MHTSLFKPGRIACGSDGSPPPLWGRARVGGRTVLISLARRHALTFSVRATPHPGPPPQGGRERAAPSVFDGTSGLKCLRDRLTNSPLSCPLLLDSPMSLRMGGYHVTSGRAALRWIAATILLVTTVGPPAFGTSQTLAAVKARGVAGLRRERGPARVLLRRRARRVVRFRRRLLPRRRGRHFRRSEQGAARSAVRRRPVSGAEGRKDRRSLPQFDLDHGPRDRIRADLRRRHLLRRAGLPASPFDARQFGAGAGRGQECACRAGPRPSTISPTSSPATI